MAVVTVVPVMVGAAVAHDEATLRYQNRCRQRVGLSKPDAPLLHNIYDAAATSLKWCGTGRDADVAPSEKAPLEDKFSRSFIFDPIAPDRSEFSSRITDSDKQLSFEDFRLGAVLCGALNDRAFGRFGVPKTILGLPISCLPGSTLEPPPPAINKREVSGDVVSYDVDIRHRDQPEPTLETVVTVDI